MKQPTALLTADWHLRADRPECRTDDFTTAMWRKVEFILQLAQSHSVPILLAGDIGHRPQWPNWLLERLTALIEQYEAEVIVVPGQHDLPQHNLALYRKSGLGVLATAGVVKLGGEESHLPISASPKVFPIIVPFPYGQPLKKIAFEKYMGGKYLIAITHQLVIGAQPDWPGQQASSAASLLKRFPEYRLILSGDNHKPFTKGYKGRLLVNPGSMMRAAADQANHRPCVYLWDVEANEVEAVYLPIEDGVIDRSHIDGGFLSPQQRDERIGTYVDRLDQSYEISLSYENNLTEHMSKNNTEPPVEERVWEALEK